MTRNRILAAIGLALTAAAIEEQLKLPPEQRTWHGRILGIPYDLRKPTWDRVRSTLWNENNPSIVAPTVFGIGWSINLYRLMNLAKPAGR